MSNPMTEGNTPFRSGFIAIVGRPNVGKSTLMNHILGQKISITSNKPQTTRHRILGIKTEADYQAIFIDTPGLHLNAKSAMNRYLNRSAHSSIEAVDMVFFVVEAVHWDEEDESVLRRLQQQSAPVVLVINKVDRIPDKERLLPIIQKLSEKMAFAAVVPVSALKGVNLAQLDKLVYDSLSEGDAIFPEDYITDRSERFLAAEIVREKLFRSLGKELPYASTVEIEHFKDDNGLLRIAALIWVERQSQKKIVIGKGGERLKSVGQQARIDMEKLFEQKVFLECWVKVKEGWSDNERLLNSLGYRDEL